jgi:hypothetical protein
LTSDLQAQLRKRRSQRLDKWPEFTKSEAAVLDLVTKAQARFPRTTPYILHTDNFFTSYALYSKLHELGIGANETVKGRVSDPFQIERCIQHSTQSIDALHSMRRAEYLRGLFPEEGSMFVKNFIHTERYLLLRY